MLTTTEQRYLDELVSRVQESLPDVVGVYLFGSGAYGDHDPRRSDLDVAVVVAADPQPVRLTALVAAVRHAALPCPARRLELVVYPREVVARPRPPLAFALNLDTGAGMADRLSTEADGEEAHWFVLDVAAGRHHGVALVGPPVGDVFGPVAASDVRKALAASLAWHLRHEPGTANTVLNACRAWHHVETGSFAAKRDAADWLLARRPDLGVIADALEARCSGRRLRVTRVRRLVEEAMAVVADDDPPGVRGAGSS